ncbi:NAD(P)-binding protein [Daedalea quercina L-15889]|uniref:NAD(P)-binding protein n=1 Tax=Daedalea quercina L-15889 TaxID=1314783 RepID=A0A165TDZ3_9APHY|nr:NAD(P)-binding protein [Daedalea quercina L-15889]
MAHLQTPAQHAVPFSRPATPGHVAHHLGFYGLGAMGYFMARNLAKTRSAQAGSSPLLVYNRSPGKCQQLQKELGADKVQIAKSPEELVQECDIIFTSLASDAAVKSVYEQFAAALKAKPPTKNKILVEMSTTYPSLAGELDTLLSEIPHTHLVTGPVFGPPAAADAGTLLCILAGEYRAKKEVAHILVPGVGKKVMDLGGNLEKAPIFKLIGNSMILGSIEVLAEAFTLSEKTGIGSATTYELIKDLLPAPPFVNYGNKMATDAFDGLKGFAIDGGLKDANHVRRLVTEYNSPMPTVDAAHSHLLTARAIHQEQTKRGEQAFDVLDWSGMVAGTRVAAGLDAFSSAQPAKVVKE